VKRWKKTLFALLTLLAVIVALNIAADKLVRHPAAEAYEGIYQGHPTRIHQLKPGARATIPIGLFGNYHRAWKKSGAVYQVEINPQGFRDRPFGPKTDFRIIALGDSSTFGWDVEAAETWPKVLENLLLKNRRPVEVLNLGVPGYSSHQGLMMLKEVWPLEPDLLIIAYGRNDELDTAFSPTEHGRGRADAELMPGDRVVDAVRPSFRQRLRSTGLYRAVQRLHEEYLSSPHPDRAPAPAEDQALRRVPPPRYRENLRQMIQEAEQRGVPVVLVSLGCFFEKYRQALMTVGRETDVPALDTFPLFFEKVPAIKTDSAFQVCREQLISRLGIKTLDSSAGGWLWFSTDFGHPNACGHQVIAEAVAPLLPLH